MLFNFLMYCDPVILACFLLQAVQSRLYDDYAALYYLLLNKWEHGQLHISNATSPISFSRQCQSTAASINTADPNQSPSESHTPWHHIPASASQRSDTWDEYPNDPCLVRYLKLGRRHTLGAAQNHMLLPHNELGHLREASESSSHASNDAGSSNNASLLPLGTGLLQSSGQNVGQYSSSNASDTSSMLKTMMLQPPTRPRVGRRASDGGPYAAVFRLYLERRMPQLAQINSQSSLRDNTSYSFSSSVKQLLLDKRSQEAQYIKQTPQSKEWLHNKDQVNCSSK